MRIYSVSRMNELEEKIEESKKALRLAAEMSKEYYNAPLIITYSGGKDSDVMLHLAESCLNPDEFEVLNSHTSVDAPPTVYHIRKVFKRLEENGIKSTVHIPRYEDGTQITMWNLIPKKQIPPTRFARYCCKSLKETSTPNRLCALGVRSSESTGRAGRDIFSTRGSSKKTANWYSIEHTEEVFKESKEFNAPEFDCTLIANMKSHNDTMVNPIYKWSDSDVWEYIRANSIETNPLYEMGYKRVGCIGCPMATYNQKMKEFKDFPTYEKAYKNAFKEMLKIRKLSGEDDVTGKKNSHVWETEQDVFDWWIQKWQQGCKGQMNMSDFMN